VDAVPFLAAILAVWRVAHLVAVEDGPFDVFLRLRRRAAAAGAGRLLGCFLCFSVWTAAGVALLVARDVRSYLLLVPALSGGAILLERATSRGEEPLWIEEESS
jgi:hypothetical protein